MSLRHYYIGNKPADTLVDRIQVLIFDPQVGEIHTTLGELKTYIGAGLTIQNRPPTAADGVDGNLWLELIT